MKNYLSETFTDYQDIIKDIYSGIVELNKSTERINKKGFTDLKKISSYILSTITNDKTFFNQDETLHAANLFLYESLGHSQNHNIDMFGISCIKYLDINVLLKDKNFLIYLRYIIIADLIIQEYKEHNHPETSFTIFLKEFFGDIRSIFLIYCIIKEENLTLNKIRNITSYILQDATLVGQSELTDNEKEILREIQTGIKYERIKYSGYPTNSEHSKSNKFDILAKVKNTITIEYINKESIIH